MNEHDELVENFVNGLFRNGAGQEAEHLVLTTREGRDLGRWCRKAVRDRVFDLIAELKEQPK